MLLINRKIFWNIKINKGSHGNNIAHIQLQKCPHKKYIVHIKKIFPTKKHYCQQKKSIVYLSQFLF